MELWSDYEGRTIDGAFPLKKLILPQGRSAFFSTANRKGEAVLIRLVACHFDEDEILARWRGVQALNHPSFLRLERYGQLEMDDTKVVYAAFERTDANLAHVVSQGRLTVSDARQLAVSLASALEMLHANGFIHEHMEPESVFAIGEVVKLRTDCIRESPEGAEGQRAKMRDVRDLAGILLQALTQERTLEAAVASRQSLPAPFDEIVPKAMTGEWGLSEVAFALRTSEPASRVRPAPPAATTSAPAPASSAAPPQSASPASPPPHQSNHVDVYPSALRSQVRSDAWQEEKLPDKKWIGAAALAVVALILVWVGWRVAYHRSPSRGSAHQAAQQTAGSAVHAPHAAASGSSPALSGPAPSAPTSAKRGRLVWRVVAYTYNNEQMAQKKSADIAQRHPDLRPAVFSPAGHTPYLVTIGGVMDRSDAVALAHRAGSLGLPRDTYARNYKR